MSLCLTSIPWNAAILDVQNGCFEIRHTNNISKILKQKFVAEAEILTKLKMLNDHILKYSAIPMIPYKRKFSRESNFRYFRERFENAKICLREKLYLKRKFKSWYRYDILLHTLSNLKSGCKSRNHLV